MVIYPRMDLTEFWDFWLVGLNFHSKAEKPYEPFVFSIDYYPIRTPFVHSWCSKLLTALYYHGTTFIERDWQVSRQNKVKTQMEPPNTSGFHMDLLIPIQNQSKDPSLKSQ